MRGVSYMMKCIKPKEISRFLVNGKKYVVAMYGKNARIIPISEHESYMKMEKDHRREISA